MDDPLSKGPESINNDHQGIGRGKPKHVRQKVFCQSTVFRIVMEVAVEGDDEGEEENQQVQGDQQLTRDVEVEHGLEVAESEECEELDVPLDQDFHEHPPEGVDAEESADLVIEQAVEEPVQQHHEDQSQGQEEDEVVRGALDEEVALPLLVEIGGVG